MTIQLLLFCFSKINLHFFDEIRLAQQKIDAKTEKHTHTPLQNNQSSSPKPLPFPGMLSSGKPGSYMDRKGDSSRPSGHATGFSSKYSSLSLNKQFKQSVSTSKPHGGMYIFVQKGILIGSRRHGGSNYGTDGIDGYGKCGWMDR